MPTNKYTGKLLRYLRKALQVALTHPDVEVRVTVATDIKNVIDYILSHGYVDTK